MGVLGCGRISDGRVFTEYRSMSGMRSVMARVVTGMEGGNSGTLFRCYRGFSGTMLDSLLIDRRRVSRTFSLISRGFVRVVGGTGRGVAIFRRGREHGDFVVGSDRNIIINRGIVPLSGINLCIPNNATTCPSAILVSSVPTGVTNIGRVMVMAPPGGRNGMGPIVLTTTGVTKISGVFGINNTRTITTLTCNARDIPTIRGVMNPNGTFITRTGERIFNGISVSVVTNPDRVLVITSNDYGPGCITTSLLSRTRRSGVTDTILIASSVTLTGTMDSRLRLRVPGLLEDRVTETSVSGGNGVVITRGLGIMVSVTGRVTPRRLRLYMSGPFSCLSSVHRTNSVFVNGGYPRTLKSCFTKPGRALPADNATGFSDTLSISSFMGGARCVCCAGRTLDGINRSMTCFTRGRKLATRTGDTIVHLRSGGW